MAGSRTLKLSILADVDNLKKNLDSGSKEVEGFGGKLEKFGKVAAAAFAAATAAAVAYAGKLAIEGVKAAIEDEAAQNRLANALKNVTGATNEQIAAVEEQITQMSLAFGVADDELRPAYQRLATATGDLSKAEEALSLALDISAATGKDVNAVAQALGKAYEGNTSALARLGIGLSAAEIKTLGFDGTMRQLADTFEGAATVQANTLEGQIRRLQITFDEAKESVGAGLLPIVQSLMNYFVNVFIPRLIEVKNKALDPIITAFNNNEDAMRALFNFGKQYLVPFFENTLFAAVESVGKAIGGIINIVGFVVREIERLTNIAITAINAVIEAYNRIPILPNVDRIKPVNFGSSQSSSTGLGSRPLGGRLPAASSSPSVSSNPIISAPTTTQAAAVSSAANAASQVVAGSFNSGQFRLGEAAAMQGINITVNGAIDPVSTARQIADILNSEAATSGTFTNLGNSRFAMVAI